MKNEKDILRYRLIDRVNSRIKKLASSNLAYFTVFEICATGTYHTHSLIIYEYTDESDNDDLFKKLCKQFKGYNSDVRRVKDTDLLTVILYLLKNVNSHSKKYIGFSFTHNFPKLFSNSYIGEKKALDEILRRLSSLERGDEVEGDCSFPFIDSDEQIITTYFDSEKNI